MTNPDNSIGTNGAFGGRTSVNAFNDVMGCLSRGILSGWACVPNSGLTVSIGGDGTTRDVAIAEDNAGNRTSINNISNSPVDVTIGAAPGTNSRIDSIVAYVDNPPEGDADYTDNPGACGLIVVEGTSASSPTAPDDSDIRTAITADGASGTTAYYVVLAYVTMASGTTDITADEITAGESATLGAEQIADSSIKVSKVDFDSVPQVVVAEFDNGNTTSTVRVLLGQDTLSGFDTGWTYLCVVSLGLFLASGSSSAIAFGDFTVNETGEYVVSDSRIRASYYQTTVSYTTEFTPADSSFTLNFNGSGSSSGASWEGVKVYFIPLRPLS